jgi:hypothetical protein
MRKQMTIIDSIEALKVSLAFNGHSDAVLADQPLTNDELQHAMPADREAYLENVDRVIHAAIETLQNGDDFPDEATPYVLVAAVLTFEKGEEPGGIDLVARLGARVDALYGATYQAMSPEQRELIRHEPKGERAFNDNELIQLDRAAIVTAFINDQHIRANPARAFLIAKQAELREAAERAHLVAARDGGDEDDLAEAMRQSLLDRPATSPRDAAGPAPRDLREEQDIAFLRASNADYAKETESLRNEVQRIKAELERAHGAVEAAQVETTAAQERLDEALSVRPLTREQTLEAAKQLKVRPGATDDATIASLKRALTRHA